MAIKTDELCKKCRFNYENACVKYKACRKCPQYQKDDPVSLCKCFAVDKGADCRWYAEMDGAE